MTLLRVLLAGLLLCLASPALAQTCTATTPDFNFGTVSLRSGAVNQTSGSVTVECRGGLLGGTAHPGRGLPDLWRRQRQ
ncbi:MAG: hypothetical protein ACT4OK_06220 [Gemmobacter sp.]